MGKAFCDECNKNEVDIHFIMAGWTASVESWEWFSDAWQQCLHRKPSIDYFKTSECASVNDQFGKMSKKQAASKKLSLARVITKHRLQGYVTTAPHAYLQSKPQRLRKMVGTRMYDWAFISIVSTILEHSLYLREKEEIDFVFDNCSELRSCISSYENMKPNLPLAMQQVAGVIIPGDDHKLSGLQAADLLAGEHSTYMRTGRKDESYAEMERAKVPVLVLPASPPTSMGNLIQYADGVYKREDIVKEMLRYLKAQGIKL
jgi:hypothetical protein